MSSGNNSSPKHLIIGQSVEGRPITCEVYGTAQISRTVLILASIHGNEPAGTPLLRRLGDYLQANPHKISGRRVLLVPKANPDGVAHQERHNRHGVDLNRNFPAANWRKTNGHGSESLSEPESRALYDLIAKHKPDRIISLHQPLYCLDYNGPAQTKSLTEAMASVCDLKMSQVGALEGSLGSYAGNTLHIPIVTVEFDAEANKLDESELWNRYGKMLTTAIQYPF